jgi:hypothetical protein
VGVRCQEERGLLCWRQSNPKDQVSFPEVLVFSAQVRTV